MVVEHQWASPAFEVEKTTEMPGPHTDLLTYVRPVDRPRAPSRRWDKAKSRCRRGLSPPRSGGEREYSC